MGQSGNYQLHLFRGDRRRSSTLSAPPLCGGQARHDPLPRQRSLVLGERAEQREQQLAMRRGGIHLFGQRPEGDAAFLEVGDDRQAASDGGSMKLVVLGLSLSSSWGNGHATTFRALLSAFAGRGHEIRFLERDVPWYAGQRDLIDPAFCRLALSESVEALEDWRREIVPVRLEVRRSGEESGATGRRRGSQLR